jgi:O-antigen ligase
MILGYFLASLSVPSLLQSSATGILIIIVALWKYRKDFVEVYKAIKSGWLLLIAAFLVGAVTSGHPSKSIIAFYDWLRASAILFSLIAIVTNFKSGKIISSAKYFYLFSAVVIFLIFIYVGFQGDTFTLRYNQVLNQNIGNLHEFANLSAITLLVMACLYVSGASKEKILIPAMFAMLVVIYFTTSKGNYISIALCGVYLALGIKYKRIWYVALSCFMLGYVYLFFLCAGSCNAPAAIQSTLLSRKEIYADTLALVYEHPWFGQGINTFKYSSGLNDPSGTPYIMPHNIYLEQLYSWGIVGTLLFFSGLIVILYRTSKKPVRDLRSNKFMTTLGYTLLIYSFSRGLLDLKFFSFHFMALVMFSVALVVIGKYAIRKPA